MNIFQSAIIGFLAMALPLHAQDVRWELVDTGILNHSSHGQGIEMRIKPDPSPEGLFDSDNLGDIMSRLCRHYAPSVIPYVQEQTGLETPDFIAVRLISGGGFGRYVLQAYVIADGGCGDEL
jgi:hypothetical protein